MNRNKISSDFFTQKLPDKLYRDVTQNGLIVIDTNILLKLYSISSKERILILKILNHPNVLSRLWFPYRVESEFYHLREKVLGEKLELMKRSSKEIEKVFNKLKNDLDKVIKVAYPDVKRNQWNTLIEDSKQNILSQLNILKYEYPSSKEEDSLLSEIVTLFDGRCGKSFDKYEYGKIFDEGINRLKYGIPPGFMDSGKEEIENQLGDYFIWKQTLNECTKRGKHLLFITDDKKEDWWHNSGYSSEKAHPELRAEFHRETKYHCEFMDLKAFLSWEQTLTKPILNENEHELVLTAWESIAAIGVGVISGLLINAILDEDKGEQI